MHLTTIILKDGRIFSSPIEKIQYDLEIFEKSYIKLFDYPDMLYIKDMQSAVTEKERVSVNKIEDADEIKKMREYWEKCKSGEIYDRRFKRKSNKSI